MLSPSRLTTQQTRCSPDMQEPVQVHFQQTSKLGLECRRKEVEDSKFPPSQSQCTALISEVNHQSVVKTHIPDYYSTIPGSPLAVVCYKGRNDMICWQE